jgi:putative ABC transport system permease protein
VVSSFDIAKNSVFVWSQRTSIAYKGFKPGRFVQFTNDDVDAIRRTIPEVAILAPRNFLPGNYTVNRGTKNEAFNVYGEYPDLHRREARAAQQRPLHQLPRHPRPAQGGRDRYAGAQGALQGRRRPHRPVHQHQGRLLPGGGRVRGKGDVEDNREDARTVFIPSTTLQQAFNQYNKVASSPWCPSPACGRP